MSGNVLVDALSNLVSADVEALTPAVFVQIGGEIVVSIQRRVSR